jgi:hypothetical protein
MVCRAAIVAGLVFAAQAASSAADIDNPFGTGNLFLPLCTGEDPLWGGEGTRLCTTYIAGFLEGFSGGVVRAVDAGSQADADVAIKRFRGYCLPSGVTGGQLRDVLVQYLEENPASRHKSVGPLVLRAFQEAFPCKP